MSASSTSRSRGHQSSMSADHACRSVSASRSRSIRALLHHRRPARGAHRATGHLCHRRRGRPGRRLRASLRAAITARARPATAVRLGDVTQASCRHMASSIGSRNRWPSWRIITPITWADSARFTDARPVRRGRGVIQEKAGWVVASAADGAAAVTGHLPARAGTGRLGQFRSQRLNANQRKPPALVTLCHQRPSATARQAIREMLQTADYSQFATLGVSVKSSTDQPNRDGSAHRRSPRPPPAGLTPR